VNQLDDDRERPAPAPAQQPQMTRVAMPSGAPSVTYTLIAITVIVYLLQVASEVMLRGDILIWYGARYNPAIQAGELWRFLTPALLHASFPSIAHILFNMYALFSFGTVLERHFGHGRFLLLYVLGAYTGNVISFLLSSEESRSVGASTAIFGLLGAEAIFLFQNRKLFAGQFSRSIQNLVFIAIVTLIIGTQSGIDHWGHVGGLLGGLMFTWFAGPLYKIEGVAPALHVVDQRSTRDVILGAATVILVFSALAMWGMIRQ
jgi:rhomboid protease GluP